MKLPALNSSAAFALILLFSFSSVQAQNDTDVKDPKAKAILDKLSAKTKNYSTISADFEYKLVNEKDGIDESQSGSILMKGDNYVLSIAGQEITSDGKTMWTYLEDVGEVQISDVPTEEEAGDDMFASPSNIFTLYEEGFKYLYDKVTAFAGVNCDVIKLFPEDPSQGNYHTIKLYIDKEKTEMKAVEIFAKDGNVYTYLLKNFAPNVEITESTFTFDESKADDVIDLR